MLEGVAHFFSRQYREQREGLVEVRITLCVLRSHSKVQRVNVELELRSASSGYLRLAAAKPGIVGQSCQCNELRLRKLLPANGLGEHISLEILPVPLSLRPRAVCVAPRS